MAVAPQPRIIQRDTIIRQSSSTLPACFSKISPELIFTVIGIIVLPFLMPFLLLIVELINCLFQTWLCIVSTGAFVVLATTLAFVKMLAMGAGILTITLVVLYLFVYSKGGNDKSKGGCGVKAGFGDFCLTIAYSCGLPIPGSLINFLASDGQ